MPFIQQSLDSSVGRAEDCKGKIADILRSLVQIRFEGDFFYNYKNYQNAPKNMKGKNIAVYPFLCRMPIF